MKKLLHIIRNWRRLVLAVDTVSTSGAVCTVEKTILVLDGRAWEVEKG